MIPKGISCRTVGDPTTTAGESRVGGNLTRWASRVKVRLAEGRLDCLVEETGTEA